jgi:hypothetical protein
MTQLIQIGVEDTAQEISILEMFQQMADREAAMIREARERALQRCCGTSAEEIRHRRP